MSARGTGRSASAGWFTSSYSNNGGTCVQVRFVGGQVQVADSKDGGRGPVITVSGVEWDQFVVAALADDAGDGAALSGIPVDGGGRMVTGPDGTALRYTAAEWAAFLAGAADGEFRRPAAATLTP